MHDRSPAFYQEVLARELIRLREEHGVTQKKLAKEVGWSQAKVIRQEGCKLTIKEDDLDRILEFHGIILTPQGEELQELGMKARQKPWWHPYKKGISPEYLRFIDLEIAADHILSCHPRGVPDQLQTREYATAILEESVYPKGLHHNVDIKMMRQMAISNSTHYIKEVYILCESTIGSLSKSRREESNNQLRQLHHLAATLPSVNIHIIPFEVVSYPHFEKGWNSVLYFNEKLPKISYAESWNTPRLAVDESETEKHFDDFKKSMSVALDVEDSTALLKEYTEKMPRR